MVDQLKNQLFTQMIGGGDQKKNLSLAQQLINQVKSGAGYLNTGGMLQNNAMTDLQDFYNRLF